ncbi:hypothetical protein DI272_18945 [Streptomyces sp. Act143]|uniref:hypothetical protein n=1 Tax=Streptomyces sp. Act143 TaxID=2200760 RepID=UPI000D67C7CF|nr:hypothetical protein [Streptomyces sp. Act143]PWI16011.1 hypothetical protein DI272_18945 [Streptomyces sp. Act143]
MFTETVDSGSSTTTGTASEPHALVLLRRACNRGYAIEPQRTGGAIIRWRRIDPGTLTPALRSITLTPQVPADPTDYELSDLRVIASVPVVRLVDSERYTLPVIEAGVCQIPPSRAERLLAQGFLLNTDNEHLRLTLAARLSLVAAAHERMDSSDRTTTWCSCGLAVHARDAEAAEARQAAHLAAVGADFVQSLDAAFTAAVATV